MEYSCSYTKHTYPPPIQSHSRTGLENPTLKSTPASTPLLIAVPLDTALGTFHCNPQVQRDLFFVPAEPRE